MELKENIGWEDSWTYIPESMYIHTYLQYTYLHTYTSLRLQLEIDLNKNWYSNKYQ